MLRTLSLASALLLIAAGSLGCAASRNADGADARELPAEEVLADDARLEPLFAFLEAENITVLHYFSRMPPIRSQSEAVYTLEVRAPAYRTRLTVYVYPSEEAAREELRQHPNFRILEGEYEPGSGWLRVHPNAFQNGSLIVRAPLLEGALRRSFRPPARDEQAAADLHE